MRAAVDFLNLLGQVFSTAARSADGDPARKGALEDATFDALRHLLEQDRTPVFDFVDGDVLFASQRVGRLSDWEWTGALTSGAVDRIEISQGVAREEFGRFLGALLARLHPAMDGTPEKAVPGYEVGFPHIRFGRPNVGESEVSGKSAPDSTPALQEEAEAVDWLLGQAGRGERISLSLTGAVVESLLVALHRVESVLGLLVPLGESDEYTAVHSMNAAVLAMGLAEALGFAVDDVKAVGEAAILHDVGKTRVPADILGKPGELSPEEWDVLRRHPAEGARILMNFGPEMELPAIVAYEHHIRYDGSGYPGVRYARELHRVTQLFQVCDVYDALRTPRPYRDPWPVGRIVSHLRAESGKSLYPEAVEAFTGMLPH